MDKNIPITGHTGFLCLLGSPVAHSISPAIHNEACKLLGADYKYLAFDVGVDGLETVVQGLRKMQARGWNLTMPDKNRMAQLVDRLSPASAISGAVNTVVNDDGILTGYTTDGTGWMMSANATGHSPVGKKMVQLGAGGAGTSILVQAAMDGVAQIDVFNAQDGFWPHAKEIVKELNASTQCRVFLHALSDLNALRDCMAEAAVLLNTTPVGMPRVPGCLIPDTSYFHPGLAVFDAIYEPKETRLLQMAREAGLDTSNGMYMLMYQAAAAFRLWTGLEMPVAEIGKKFFAN